MPLTVRRDGFLKVPKRIQFLTIIRNYQSSFSSWEWSVSDSKPEALFDNLEWPFSYLVFITIILSVMSKLLFLFLVSL